MKEQNKKYMYKWFVITVIGGKEESIKDALIEKMKNFGYWEQEVKEIRVFMIKKEEVETFTKTDPNLPGTLKNTKTTQWETLSDGRYRRIKSKTVNRFPSYIFVNMHWDRDVWYAIRNTVGVLGFIGSTGKGSVPTPIHMQEYENILQKEASKEYVNKISLNLKTPIINQSANSIIDEKQKTINIEQPPFKVGNVVVINSGSLSGTKATIKEINIEKKVAKIEYDFFGRANIIEISFNDIKLADNL